MSVVLVVDDNERDLRLSSTLLIHAGHAVLGVEDAEKGLELARSAHPDLILMDLILPGMDGWEAVAALKADPATAAIPILVVSAFLGSQDQEKALALGCVGWIAKPFNHVSFLETIGRALDGGVGRA